MKEKFYPKLFFSVLFIAILFLAFLITKPFLIALLTGAIIAYLAHPMYLKIKKYIKNEDAAAFLCSILTILIITIPLFIILGLASKEAYSTYSLISQNNRIEQKNLGANFMEIMCKDEEWLGCKGLRSFVGFLPNNDLDYFIRSSVEKVTGFVYDSIASFIAGIPALLLNFFIIIFVIYYLLKDGETTVKRIKNLLPLKESHKGEVLQKFHDVTYAVFYGNLSVAAIQGILGAVGFFVLGVKSPVLWGFVMIVFALVPYFGTALIWLPAALNLIFFGYLQNDSSYTWKGIILIIYGIVVISSIDNILKPRIIWDHAQVHPILVLLGVLGGLNLFGIVGLLFGPLLLALLMTFIEIYEQEKSEMGRYF